MQALFGECGIVKTKKWAFILMMFWCMMFAGVVGTIKCTLLPKILESALRMPTFKLMKALTHQFGGLGSHCSHCEALGSDVVGGDGLESVGCGQAPLMWFKVGWQACSHSRARQVLPWRLTT